MNFPFYIASRYFKAKKSHNIINLISWITIVAISITTMSLIIVLSVFNGFQNLIVSQFSVFNADLQITATQGKTFNIHNLPFNELKNNNAVAYLCEIAEENALLKYGDKQFIVNLKGVSNNYTKLNHFDTTIIIGEFMLEEAGRSFGVFGAGVAYNLDLSMDAFPKPISVFIPDRKNASLSNPVNAFNNDYLQCSGIFSVKQEIDTKYVIVPLSFVRKMMNYKDELTSIEISLKKGYDDKEVQADIQKLLGENFTVKNRYQQEALLYKVMKSEKWAVFLILVFILLIATFNVIGSVTLLILDKKKDIAILASMGADSKLVRKIFLFEGLIINLAGALIGLSLGALICFLQYEFGFVKLQTSAMFIVTAYPVIMQFWDFILVFATVLIIGFAASYYPTRSISKKYIYHRVNE